MSRFTRDRSKSSHLSTLFGLFGALAFLGAGWLVACSSGTTDGTDSNGGATGGSKSGTSKTSSNVSSLAEQKNGACPSSPEKLRGTTAAGGSCSTYADCRPSCCGCDSGSSSYLAAACVDGKCADKADACYSTKSDTFCPGEPGGPDDGGGTSGTGTDTQGSSTDTTICTDGTSSSCYGSNKTWTGTQCCVSNVKQCVDGTSSSCYGSNKTWTGAKCCLSGKDSICTDGTSSSCYGSNETWTGEKCCVSGVTQCVDGTSSSCYGGTKTWTGAKCCL